MKIYKIYTGGKKTLNKTLLVKDEKALPLQWALRKELVHLFHKTTEATGCLLDIEDYVK